MNFVCSSSSIGLGQDLTTNNAKQKKSIKIALCTRNGTSRVFCMKYSQGILGSTNSNI